MAKRQKEKWSRDIFQDINTLATRYQSLTSRELVIVMGATLDAALSELIELRLVDDPKVAEQFLDDGADSFSSKIKLAYLLGILHKEQMAMLNIMREIRNSFAHDVNVSLLSQHIQDRLLNILQRQFNFQKDVFDQKLVPHDPGWMLQLQPLLSKDENTCRSLLIGMLLIQQGFFDKLKHDIKHLQLIKLST
jgi:hypothetical protein